MPRYRLDLTLRHAEGALIRVLGVAERRGFRPLSVNGATNAGGERWRLQLAVEGDRPAEALRVQLATLYDCLAVEVSPC